jgi:hypothetical protein
VVFLAFWSMQGPGCTWYLGGNGLELVSSSGAAAHLPTDRVVEPDAPERAAAPKRTSSRAQDDYEAREQSLGKPLRFFRSAQHWTASLHTPSSIRSSPAHVTPAARSFTTSRSACGSASSRRKASSSHTWPPRRANTGETARSAPARATVISSRDSSTRNRPCPDRRQAAS